MATPSKRDPLGRPLPRDATGSSPEEEPEFLCPSESLDRAQKMLDADRPSHAHEVLEAAWKAAPDQERHLWQALAQLAVGMTHAARGNTSGAQALLRRGAELLDHYQTAAPWNIDVAGLQRWAKEPTGLLQDSAGSSALRSPQLRSGDDVARLRRWEEFGGTWRVEARTGSHLTLALCRCDGGEEADRWTSTDPKLLSLVGSRTSSDQTI